MGQRMIKAVFNNLIVILCVHGMLTAQSQQQPYVLQRICGSVTIDGLSTEPAWESVRPFPMVTQTPTFGKEPSERTEIRIAYDTDFMYVAGRFYESDPTNIQGNLMRRDEFSGSDDEFAVILDTYNDNQNAVLFVTSPAGRRTDVTVINDAVNRGVPATDESWNTFWDVEVVRNDEGWFAEMRIPFSSLRFQSQDGNVTVGLITWRWIARKNEINIFPAILPNWVSAFMKPSVAQKVILDGIREQSPVYVSPYALIGVKRRVELNNAGTTYGRIDDTPGELGLDLKYNFTSNLALDLSVNTDFAQVEADDQRINLTRFSLFFPEKRQFFLERASTFSFTTGLGRLFDSRRIGLSDQGMPLRIYGGARVVGRIGKWDVGALDMQTESSDGSSSENSGILRFRRQILNDFSALGAMVTSRLQSDGRYNIVYGLDGELQLAGNDILLTQWVQSFEKSVRATAIEKALVRLSWERNARTGFGYKLGYVRSGEMYNPGLGFMQRSNFTYLFLPVSYGWIPDESSFFQNHTLFLTSDFFLHNNDRSIESADVSVGWNGETKSGEFYKVGLRATTEDLTEPLAFSEETLVPAGKYHFYTFNVSYSELYKAFTSEITLEAGSFYDGTRISVGLSPIWRASRYLEFVTFFQFDRIRFPDREQSFDGKVLRLRLNISLNPKVSLSPFVQWNSAANVITLNMRFRYNIREGNDFYLVYNEGLNTDRERVQPVLPSSNSRAILAKYTHTFDL